MARPLRADPTRTTTLALRYFADAQRRLRRVDKAIQQLIVEEDAFGLAPKRHPITGKLVANARFAFLTDDGKTAAFRDWLSNMVDAEMLDTVDGVSPSSPWNSKYIDSAYKKGIVRAYLDANKQSLADDLPGYAGTKAQFLQEAFGSPEATSKIKLLATRSFEQMKGLTGTMKQQLNTALSDGIAAGRGPREIARQLHEQIGGISKVRARTIARTELVNAHAEGQLDSFAALGVEELGVMAEWKTAGDDRVCGKCAPLEGIIISVKEARGMIPRHPNCRCAWVPANVGEPTVGQTWAADEVSAKVRQSLKAELPKVKDAVQRRKLSRWLGAATKIGQKTGLKPKKGPPVFQTKARLERVFVKAEYKLADSDFIIPKKGSQFELTPEGLAKVAKAEGYTGPLDIPPLPSKADVKIRHQVNWIKEAAAQEADNVAAKAAHDAAKAAAKEAAELAALSPKERAVRKIVKATEKDGKERAFLLKPDGSVTKVIVGDLETVDLSHPLANKPGQNLHSYHTHPIHAADVPEFDGYTGLSTGDLSTLHQSPGISRITAVDLDGKEFTVVKLGTDDAYHKEIWLRNKAITADVLGEITDDFIAGKTTKEVALKRKRLAPLEIIKRLEDEGLIVYAEATEKTAALAEAKIAKAIKAAAAKAAADKKASDLAALVAKQTPKAFTGDAFHVTKASNVPSIAADGLQPMPGTFGKGVYFSADANPKAATGLVGDEAAVVRVKFKSKNRLDLDMRSPDSAEWAKHPDYQIWEGLGNGDAEQLLAAGYDSVRVRFLANDWTVALTKDAFDITSIDTLADLAAKAAAKEAAEKAAKAAAKKAAKEAAEKAAKEAAEKAAKEAAEKAAKEAAKAAKEAAAKAAKEAAKAAHAEKTKQGMAKGFLQKKLDLPTPTPGEMQNGQYAMGKLATKLEDGPLGRALTDAEMVLLADAKDFKSQWEASKKIIADDKKNKAKAAKIKAKLPKASPEQAAPTAGATTAGAPDTALLARLVHVRSLPGSTKPYLAKDATTGKQWVVKAGLDPGHVRSEALADQLYDTLGFATPKSHIIETAEGPVKISEFLDGGETLQDWLPGRTKDARAKMFAEIQDGFVADALFANHDVAGLSFDNIFIVKGKPYRIDNGGALTYRAQGAAKADFGAVVKELDSLRDKNVNNVTAQIFGNITDDQINEQIADILTKKTELLAAIPDTKVRAQVAARLDYLEGRLPATPTAKKDGRVPSTTTPKTYPQAAVKAPAYGIQKSTAGRIKAARSNGTNLAADSGDVEDMNVLVWEELSANNKPQVKLHLKVTDAGHNKIMDIIGDSVKPTITSTGTGSSVHPKDKYWDAIMSAAKTVNHHQGDGEYNQKTMQALAEAANSIAALNLTSKNAVDKKMFKYYLDMITDINEAAEKGGATPVFSRYVFKKPKTKPDDVKAQFSVVTTDKINAVLKTADRGFVKEVAGANTVQAKAVHNIDLGDGVTVRYTERGGSASSRNGLALEGQLEMVLDEGVSTAAIQKAKASLKALGIDISPPDLDYEELIYLHRSIYLRNDHNLKAYKAIWNDEALSDAEKVEAIKKWAVKRYNVKFPAKPNADYNPHGVSKTSFGDGYRHWERWDLPASQIEKEMEDYTLYHNSSDLGNFVDSVLGSGGEITTTTGRIRKGVSLSRTGGMSSASDINSGGASYFFTRISTKKRTEGKIGLTFKVRNLTRQDAVTYDGDRYGRISDFGTRKATIDEYKAAANKTSNETIFKEGLSLLDEIETIRVHGPTRRNEMLAIFKKHKIDTLPDGRKIEDVIVSNTK